jgi:hypothetical protein
MLPFTIEEFLGVFAAYNEAIWPAQIAAYALALFALAAVAQRGELTDRVVLAVLALFWIVNGAGYHWWQFTAVTPAAWLFGAAFLLQGALFLLLAGSGRPLHFRFGSGPRQLIGVAFIAYAVSVYPLIGPAFGHVWPEVPSFGVAPCPTTIFTFGMLLLAERKQVPPWLVAVPLLWAMIGGSAAVRLGVVEDYGLIVAGAVGGALLLAGRGTTARLAGQPTPVR